MFKCKFLTGNKQMRVAIVRRLIVVAVSEPLVAATVMHEGRELFCARTENRYPARMRTTGLIRLDLDLRRATQNVMIRRLIMTNFVVLGLSVELGAGVVSLY